MKLGRALMRMVESGSITRREANHMALENDQEFQRNKARKAQEEAIAKENRKKPSRRHQRNNFREY